MKLAVVGKGGSGKTTTSSIIARTLARQGMPVVALDCDSNPNLGISLGVGDEEHTPTWDGLLQRYGSDGPDGVRLAVVSRIDNPEPG